MYVCMRVCLYVCIYAGMYGSTFTCFDQKVLNCLNYQSFNCVYIPNKLYMYLFHHKLETCHYSSKICGMKDISSRV